MAYQVEETSAHSRLAHVTVPVEDYQRSFNRALRQLSKRVKLSGFRKGKIPLSVMRRHYGQSVRQDVIEDLLRTNIDTILKDAERVIYLSQPQITKIPADKQGLEFKVEFELRPELDPVGYMGLEVARPTRDIEGGEIDERIEALRKEHSTLEPIEGRELVEEGDTVDLDFKALGDEPGLDQLAGQGVSIEVGAKQALPGIEEALVGAKFDSTLTTTVSLDANFPVEELRGKDVELEMVINSVKKRVLPELDDDFAVDTGRGQTLVELRDDVRTQIIKEVEATGERHAQETLLDELIGQNTIELPPNFVEEQIDRRLAADFKRMVNQDIDPSMLRGESFQPMRDSVRDEVVRQVRLEFLLMAIAQKEGFQTTDEDLAKYCEAQASYMNVDAKMYERYVRSDQERLQQAAASALLEKTVSALMSEAQFVDAPWPADEAEAVEAQEEE